MLAGIGSNLWAAQFYVATTGSDSNPGSESSPFLTFERARDAVRARKLAGKEGVTVNVADGMYFLKETFALEALDSGSEKHPIIYKSVNEGKAVISGATVLDGLSWKPYLDGVMMANVGRDVVDKCAFDALSTAGRKLHIARYPNFTGRGNFDGVTHLDEINERAKGYKNPATGAIHALHSSRWGSVHYRITGFDGEQLVMEGGWQQNRHRELRSSDVMIENVREELDAPGEWFLDRDANVLYVYPPDGIDLATETLYATNLKVLVDCRGSEEAPVKHVSMQGFEFRHARRVVLEDEDRWEGLNRGDWSINRSAAVMLTRTEHCSIRDCFFNQLGGNGVFFNNYNRYSEVSGSRFHKLGESAVCFVGNPACTRSNPIGYKNSIAYSQQDTTPGPNGNDYPRYCKMTDCLVFNIGRVNKQTAGAFVSMAENITISHNTVYHVPRSGITINDGCWGGHLLEYNDVFDTVIETGDHGPFNSWGRDRYWLTRHHGTKPYRQPTEFAGENVPQEEARDRSRLDVRTPIVIRNNRWWHGSDSHTWGIDLDDGSTNYHVYNNLCLGCSVKLREGFYRRVENNIFIGGEAIQFHVPFDHNSDYVCRNIVVPAKPETLPWNHPVEKIQDAAEIDRNLYWSFAQYRDPKLKNEMLSAFQSAGIDVHSVSADPQFIDPLNYDLRVALDSPAIKLGFKNFPMNNFGVKKPALKKLADDGHATYNMFDPSSIWGDAHHVIETETTGKTYTALGATVKDLTTDAEQSVAGIARKSGVYVLEAPKKSAAAKAGIRASEAILAVNGVDIHSVTDLQRELGKRAGTTVELHVVGANDRNVRLTAK